MPRPVQAPDEHLRREVARLLQQTADSKVLLGGTSAALEKAREAHKRATRAGSALPKPWAALCSYRLAHLLMREPTPNLKHVDRLLTEAGSPRCLGPWPQIYRLAVLSRYAPNQLNGAFERAVELFKGWKREPSDAELQDPRLHTDAFNVLELACYFIGADYAKLGKLEASASSQQLVAEGAYVVVTNDPAVAKVQCTLEVARDEARERAANEPNAIEFELLPGGARWRPDGIDGPWAEVNERWVRYLAVLGSGKTEKLEDWVYGETERAAAAKSNNRALRKRMNKALGSRGPVVRGKKDLAAPIVGVVHLATLTTPPDPPPRPRRLKAPVTGVSRSRS